MGFSGQLGVKANLQREQISWISPCLCIMGALLGPWVSPLFCHCQRLPAYHLFCSLSSLAAGRKSLTYFNHDPRAALQEVTFDLQDAKKVFFGSFHKVLGTVCLTPAGPDPLAWPSLHVVVSFERQALIHLGPLTLMLLYYDFPLLIWVREQIFLFGRPLQ